MTRGLMRVDGRGRGPHLDGQVAALLGLALLSLVLATILVTLVLLLVRRSPTPTAVRLLRLPAHRAQGVAERTASSRGPAAG